MPHSGETLQLGLKRVAVVLAGNARHAELVYRATVGLFQAKLQYTRTGGAGAALMSYGAEKARAWK